MAIKPSIHPSICLSIYLSIHIALLINPLCSHFSAEHATPHAASHVSRTRDAKGQKIPIVRQSMPFGTVVCMIYLSSDRREIDRDRLLADWFPLPLFGSIKGGQHGLLFIAYANNPSKFDVMLDRMVGKDVSTLSFLSFQHLIIFLFISTMFLFTYSIYLSSQGSC